MKTDYQLKVIFKLKELRENHNSSQSYITELLDLQSTGSIGNIESSKFPHKYTLEQIKIICDRFEYPLAKVFLTEDELQLPQDEFTNTLINKIIEYGK